MTPAQIAAGPTTYVWLSGSSSLQNLEGAGIEPGKAAGERAGYACTMSAAAGAALSGKKVVVYYTVEGGSFNAYSPHLSMAGEPNPKGYLPGNLKRINDLALQGSAGKCAAGSAATTNVILNGGAYDIGRYNSCDLVTKTFTTSLKGDASGLPAQSYPDRGFSDTEYLINKQNLDIVRVLGTLGGEVAPNVGQVFGVAVSYPAVLSAPEKRYRHGRHRRQLHRSAL